MKLPLEFFKQSNYLKKYSCCWFKKGTNTNITNEFATVGMNLIGEIRTNLVFSNLIIDL